MNIIELFGKIIKPWITKGKKMCSPIETGKIYEDIYCVKDKDVNIFLVKSNNGWVAIDSGYKNSISAEKGLRQLKINMNEVHAVFLTHVDLDHAGGVDYRCHNIFPEARVYVGKEEEKYLLNKYFRKKILIFNCKTPIKLQGDYQIMDNREVKIVDGVKLESIFTPGHTLGHVMYIVNDKYLFTGDSLIINHLGGYCMYDLWNIDSDMNKQSLRSIKRIAEEKKIKYFITSHTGYCDNINHAFKNIDIFPNWKVKGFMFIPEAIDNLYKE